MDKYKMIKQKIDNIITNNLKKSISYFGVNIDNKTEIECKSYFKQTNDILNDFNEEKYNLEFMKKYWFVEKVENNRLKDKERYELRLSLNSKKECKEFVNTLERLDKEINFDKTLIAKLCDMEINDLDAREAVPLYYLGIISSKEQLEALKFHFMTRRINKDNEQRYDNHYYLEYISILNKKELIKLAEKANLIIKNENYNIHLFGVDYFINEYIKYKIYFKVDNFSIDEYEKLFRSTNILSETSRNEMFIMIRRILEEYSDIYVDGFAICLDNRSITSVNLYFRFN